MNNQMNAKKIVIGAAVGGAVGCIAVYLLSSNNKKGLRNTCEEYGDKLKSLLCAVSSNINETTTSVTDKASELIESVKDEIGEFPDLSNKDFRKGLIIGGVLGGLLGSGTSLLCNGEQAPSSHWKSMVKNVFDILENNGYSTLKSIRKSKTTNDVLDLAAAGIQFWKNIKK